MFLTIRFISNWNKSFEIVLFFSGILVAKRKSNHLLHRKLRARTFSLVQTLVQKSRCSRGTSVLIFPCCIFIDSSIECQTTINVAYNNFEKVKSFSYVYFHTFWIKQTRFFHILPAVYQQQTKSIPMSRQHIVFDTIDIHTKRLDIWRTGK